MTFSSVAFYILTTLVLLGSPGPAIAALVAVGKSQGLVQGLRFYGGIQLGLAVGAGACAVGLFTAMQAAPSLIVAMTLFAAAYLTYLAYVFATAPVGESAPPRNSRFATTARGGFLLAITNPKAYFAFVALMASAPLIPTDLRADAALKWLLCVLVMIVVDLAWLQVGVLIKRSAPSPGMERALNVAMGAIIFVAAVYALLDALSRLRGAHAG